MAWKLINEGMAKAGSPEKAEKDKFNDWAKKVAGGKHPKSAAEAVGDSDYEVLKSCNMKVKGKPKEEPYSAKCCSVRLSQSSRIYFVQIDSIETVKVLRMGDHKPPSWPSEI